jgi:hypothetical protein
MYARVAGTMYRFCEHGCQSLFLLLLQTQGLRPQSRGLPSVDMNSREFKADNALLEN